MQKASEVIGRTIVAREGGVSVGKVKDIVVDEAGRRVLGFLVEEGVFKRARVAPWATVQAIGPDAVVIASQASVVKADEAPEIKSVLDKKLVIKGLRLQTTAGKDLGKIDDFRFDESSGYIVGYELSGGVLADVFKGKSYLPTPASLELGREVAFVAPEAETTIVSADDVGEESSGGPGGSGVPS